MIGSLTNRASQRSPVYKEACAIRLASPEKIGVSQFELRLHAGSDDSPDCVTARAIHNSRAIAQVGRTASRAT